ARAAPHTLSLHDALPISLVASYGALAAVFQDGLLAHVPAPFGVQPLGYVEATLPILLFCTLFGLSMDYEVFLLSRVREAYEETGDRKSTRLNSSHVSMSY